MRNEIIKDIFSEEEVEEISKAISDSIKTRSLADGPELAGDPNISKVYRIQPDMGRLFLRDVEFSDSVQKRVTDVLSIHGVKKQYLTAAYCEYSGKYGTPTLNMHKDRGPKEMVCLDYKLDSNTDWDLIIEDHRYGIPKNSGILFETANQSHGRPDRQFSSSEYVRVIFFYFT